MPSQRSKNWVFTDFALLDLNAIYNSDERIKFMGWGEEVCPKTKKKHYQGWIQMKRLITLLGMKRIFGKKIHLEPMRGTPADSEKYCKKDGKYECCGEFTTQGKRTDIMECKAAIDEGKTMLEVAQEHFVPFLKYHRGLEKYRFLVEQEKSKEFRRVEVIIHCGATGTGKTRAAVEASPDYHLISASGMQWFDGYEGQKVLIIDEYSNDVKITQLLRLLDGYQMRLAIKGGFTWAQWDTVYITTNLNKEELHEHAREEHKAALQRRITKWIHFNKI